MRMKLRLFCVLLMILITAFVPIGSAFADDQEDGAKKTAEKFLWAQSLQYCLGQSAAFRHNENYDFFKPNGIEADSVKSGDWFRDAIVSVESGAYIEAQAAGSFDDGKIWCGEGNGDAKNALVRVGLNVIGIDRMYLACGKEVGGGNGATFTPADDDVKCSDLYKVGGTTAFKLTTKDSGDLLGQTYFRNTAEEMGVVRSFDRLTDLEKYYVYELNFKSACILSDNYSFSGGVGLSVQLLDPSDNTFKKAYYSKHPDISDNSNIFLYPGTSMTCADLAGKMSSGPEFEAYKEAKLAAVNDPNAQDPDDGGDGENTDKPQATCISSGGAGSMGWIVCPFIEWVGSASEGLYDDWVKPSLNVSPTLFSGTSQTQSVWEIFRNFANIFFIILLLVVIVSQLTGYGIDNYGIKKILPKLIVSAVLINLSYLICIVAVDLSNIAGNGLQGIFNGIGGEGSTPPSDVAVSGGKGSIDLGSVAWGAGAGMVGVGLLVALIAPGVFGAIGTLAGPIIMMLVMAVVSVGLAVLFMFLLLSARQAAIVVLTVLAPIAFACFILPNTKKFFDWWLKTGWALLLLYPICGLLIGGGNFVAKVILVPVGGSSDVWTVLTATAVSIIPVFLIPYVVSESMSGITNLVTKAGKSYAKFGKAGRGMTKKTGEAINKTGFPQRVKAVAATNGVTGRFFTKGQRQRAISAELDRRSNANTLKNYATPQAAKAILDKQSEAAKVREVAQGIDDAEKRFEASGIAQNLDMMKGAYGKALADGDVEGAKAAANLLAKNHGGSGLDAIKNESKAYMRSSKYGENAAAQAVMKDVGAHVKSMHGDKLKDAQPGAMMMFSDIAAGVDPKAIMKKVDAANGYNFANVDKMSQESLSRMDAGAISDMATSARTILEQGPNMKDGKGNIVRDENGNAVINPDYAKAQELVELANNTLANKDLEASVVGGTRKAIMSLRDSGAAGEGETFNVHGNDGGAGAGSGAAGAGNTGTTGNNGGANAGGMDPSQLIINPKGDRNTGYRG